MHCCLVYKQCVHILQGKKRAKYLVKHDFKLRNHTVTEDDSERQSIEDKNWGLMAEDDNDVLSCLDCTLYLTGLSSPKVGWCYLLAKR